MKMDQGGSDEMDSLYSGSSGAEDQADTSQDTSGNDETIDQEDQKEMAQSSVVPMSVLEGADGAPVKRGDVITVKVMDVYGGSDVKICRADAYGDKETPAEDAGEGAGGETAEDELDRLGSSERM